jgi:hypothetical protein
MESTDLVSLLRIYATALKKKSFSNENENAQPRARAQVQKKRTSPPLDPGPKIQISKYVSSADDVYLSQFRDLVPAKFHTDPVSITRNYFHRRSGHVAAWRNVAVRDKRACGNLSWQPRIGFSFKEIAVFIFWTDKVTSDNNIRKSPICEWNSWMKFMDSIHEFFNVHMLVIFRDYNIKDNSKLMCQFIFIFVIHVFFEKNSWHV